MTHTKKKIDSFKVNEFEIVFNKDETYNFLSPQFIPILTILNMKRNCYHLNFHIQQLCYYSKFSGIVTRSIFPAVQTHTDPVSPSTRARMTHSPTTLGLKLRVQPVFNPRSLQHLLTASLPLDRNLPHQPETSFLHPRQQEHVAHVVLPEQGRFRGPGTDRDELHSRFDQDSVNLEI